MKAWGMVHRPAWGDAETLYCVTPDCGGTLRPSGVKVEHAAGCPTSCVEEGVRALLRTVESGHAAGQLSPQTKRVLYGVAWRNVPGAAPSSSLTPPSPEEQNPR